MSWQVLWIPEHDKLKPEKKLYPFMNFYRIKTAINCMQDSKHFFTCHSGNCLLNCSVLIHAGRPGEFFPCLHCGWRMMKGHAPDLHSSHCHYRCYCHCRSSVTPPRNLLGQADVTPLKAAELEPILSLSITHRKNPQTWWIQITYTAAGKKLINMYRGQEWHASSSFTNKNTPKIMFCCYYLWS